MSEVNWRLSFVQDTAGQERFRAICRSYYQKSAAAIIVFDITQFTSFEHIPEWVDEVNYVAELSHD